VASDPKPSLIVLTGFMGSGKSSVGRALALLLDWNFVDLDCEIEREQGRKIREIFAGEGEAEFRKIEAATLTSVLASAPRPVVLATGGGTYVQTDNAKLLRTEGAIVIFLQATPETLMRRCCDGEEGVRPLAADRDAFVRVYEERLPIYRTADITVDSDNMSPEGAARVVVEKLKLLRRSDHL
jgi:shikimate kinase